MEIFDKIACLEKTNIFADVPKSFLMQISEKIDDIEMKAGTTIFCEGDMGDAVYFVARGTVRIESDNIKLVNRSSGECFGEFAVLDYEPRGASAIAETDVLLLRLWYQDFREAVSQEPEMAFGIFSALTGKLREVAREQERWQQDMKRAHEIQMAMLPQGDFKNDKIEISGYCKPAADVGGDYYDYLFFDDDKLGILICDVTGHGFYSGLFVAMAKSCLHTQAKIDYSPKKVMESMNGAISISIQRGLLMSCCYMVIDFRNNTLTYSNASQPYPYHYSRSKDLLEQFSSTDMILGIRGIEYQFTTEERTWEKGDFLVLYSDGITEAENAQEQMFGDERLEEIIAENINQSAAFLKDCILKALSLHCGRMQPSDDVTLVVAKAL
jgi:serine phosphatase RsbU (regulator of sigma subunit)